MSKRQDLEKEFLKQLKTLSKNDPPNKARKAKKRKPKTDTGKRSKQGKSATSKRPVKQQPISKVDNTRKDNRRDASRKQDKESTPYTGKGNLKIESYKRGSNRITTTFKGVRKIENKISIFETSKTLQKEIKNRLRSHGGKPPKGMIIIVRDKKGNEAAHVTMPSFVVNEQNIQKEISKFVNELKKDYSEYAERLSDQEDESESEGYEDYNPDNIVSIDIQFIY